MPWFIRIIVFPITAWVMIIWLFMFAMLEGTTIVVVKRSNRKVHRVEGTNLV